MKKSLLDEWIVELDGATHLMRRRSAEPLEEMSTVKGNKWILSDFGGAVPRFMTVEAPVKYAEIVTQRRLLESGDSEEHARICTHWKRGRGKTSTELFFTVVEGELYSAYEDRAHDDPDHHLLFSVNALLYACLRAFSKKQTVVVLFEHDRHVDLLVGRSGQVLASSRVSSYGNTQEAKENQAETVGQEIRALFADLQGKPELIVHFNWLIGVAEEDASLTSHSSLSGKTGFSAFGQTREASASATATGWMGGGESSSLSKEQSRLMSVEWGHKLAKSFNIPFKPLKPRLFETKDNGFVVTSIPEVLNHLAVSDSSSPTLDRVRYQAQRLLPWVTFGALLMVAGLYLGALALQRQANLLTEEANQLTDIKTMASLKVDPLDPGYQKMVAFADNLNRLKAAPSLQGVLNDVSGSLKGRIEFDQVLVEYDDRSKVQLTLKGRIKEGFPQASLDHEAFIAGLTSRSYRVIKSDFATDVAELQFTLKLERE
ncbi:MAG: hypothetical protein HQL99_02595 [Magnetococcales bacterium]|nr:hypothetical protein [Magnetococcales bacterium]